MLSQYVEKRYATELLTGESEGVGYLLKDRVVQVDEFLDALERVAAGRAAFDPEVVRQLLGRTTHVDPLARLSARERSVLAEMAQGHTNAAIARRLHISQSAVEKHTNAIFDKLELAGGGGGLLAQSAGGAPLPGELIRRGRGRGVSRSSPPPQQPPPPPPARGPGPPRRRCRRPRPWRAA